MVKHVGWRKHPEKKDFWVSDQEYLIGTDNVIPVRTVSVSKAPVGGWRVDVTSLSHTNYAWTTSTKKEALDSAHDFMRRNPRG